MHGFQGANTEVQRVCGKLSVLVKHVYVVKGISPVTHKLAVLTMEAESIEDAKRRAEEAGFEGVTVKLATGVSISRPPDEANDHQPQP